MIYNTTEAPMAVIDTVWEPHTFPAFYIKPSTIAGKGLRIPHPDNHFNNLVHSVQAHLPWHQSSHGAQPEICPETNIHETAQAYHIEMALAGVSDEDGVLVQWHAPRTLIVTGGLTKTEAQIERREEDFVHLSEEENCDGMLRKVSINGNLSKKESAQPGKGHNGVLAEGKREQVKLEGTDDGEPLFILKEIRSGPFQRTFTLPADIDVDGCKTSLKHGLLRIDIPKKEPQTKQEEKLVLGDTSSGQ
jgi:HSP20 family molecular chaperone IbpA